MTALPRTLQPDATPIDSTRVDRRTALKFGLTAAAVPLLAACGLSTSGAAAGGDGLTFLSTQFTPRRGEATL